MKIKKGDTVKVLIGKDKGKAASVEKIYLSRDMILVAGVNEFKRHVKARGRDSASPGGQKSEIITITKPLPISNIALVCPKCKKITKVGWKISAKGDKIRICKKCFKNID